ncbi:MAG TPA: NAD(P)H-dependent glycerol-3-phosphate dehydrogenase [Acidiferrobacterales bacterium]|nr:NAD(P)H-dependent glycerol-3-phosphate dehydrogenase [Acidiferrobacterales bacterium]
MTVAKPVIAVLGAGSWGTALAVLLARNGYRTLFWGHDAARQARLAHERENARYLPGVRFPDNLLIREDLLETAEEAAHLLVVVPSHAFRATLEALKSRLPSEAIVAWATKGLEPATGRLLSQVAAEVLDGGRALGVISGPTFAKEVAQGLPTAVTVAAHDFVTAEAIAAWLRSDRVRVYTSTDLVGVELGGAIKNVLAIATGISDGLNLGANARAALITRGLAEMRRLTAALGGKPETVMGLAGIGDLVLTCTDNQSRNRQVGLALGKGRKLQVILAEIGQVAEGVATAREVRQLAQRMQVDMPITEQVYRVLFEGVAPQTAVEALLKREVRPE